MDCVAAAAAKPAAEPAPEAEAVVELVPDEIEQSRAVANAPV